MNLVKKIFFSFYLVLFFIIESNSTTFMPVSFETQISESDAVLEGTFLRKQYKKNQKNEVVTDAFFKIKGLAGIKLSEITNNNEFKVTYQGGIWQNIHYKVMGSPEFKKGENVIILLNKQSDGYWIHNLKLGQYNIKKNNESTQVVSSVFPFHPKHGKINYDRFVSLTEEILDTEFVYMKDVIKNYINIQNKINKTNSQNSKNKVRRKLASNNDNTINKSKSNELGIYTPSIILLLCLGVYFFYLRIREDED